MEVDLVKIKYTKISQEDVYALLRIFFQENQTLRPCSFTVEGEALSGHGYMVTIQMPNLVDIRPQPPLHAKVELLKKETQK